MVSCGVRLSEVDLEALLAVAHEVKKWIAAHSCETLNRFNGKPSVLRRLPKASNGSCEVGIIYNYLRFEEILQRQRTNNHRSLYKPVTFDSPALA